MAKSEHPVARFDQRIDPSSSRAKSFLKDLQSDTQKDQSDRGTWEADRAEFQRRRYAQEWREPTFPWPGSSNIVMPLVDKFIDQLKPQYANLMLASHPSMVVHALTPESHAKTNRVELWFDWMFRWRSPKFREELILGIDDILETGRGIWKTSWFYQTRKAVTTLDMERLPPRLRSLMVTGRSAREADQMQKALNNMGIQGGVLTRKDFDSLRTDLILPAVEKEFDLSRSDPRDKKALEEIMSWLRSGAENPITFESRDVTISSPAITQISPLDFIVPDSTTCIEEMERGTHIMMLNRQQVRSRVADAGWNREAAEKLLKKDGEVSRHVGADSYRRDQSFREGLSNRRSEVFEVHETCAYFSGALGQPDQKVVVTWSPIVDQPLKFRKYERTDWPYRTATFELNKKGWYSPRGVPEILSDLEVEVTWQHRQKLNRMAIVNAPTLKYRAFGGINPANLDWTPGRAIPVQNMQDLDVLQMPPMDFSEEREENNLRTWAEERIGGTDFGLANPLSNLQEPRTATEIRGIEQKSRSALSLRGELFYIAMEGIAKDFFDLWHTFGPQEEWIQVTGSEPLKLTKEELQGNFVFQVAGTIGEQDPAVEAQLKLARIQVLAQLQQNGLLGDRFELDMGEAVVDWLESDDVRIANRIIRRRSDEEVQQVQQERARQEELARNTLTNQAQTTEELEEGLSILKSRSPNKGAQQVSLSGG